MAASFDNASLQRLVNSASPITAYYPHTAACWVYPTTTGADRIIYAASNGTSSQSCLLEQSSSNQWGIAAVAGGTLNPTLVGTVTANAWFFVIGRFISATNRRLAVLQPDGSTVHAQNTLSRNPTAPTTLTLGTNGSGTSAFGGRIGEFWCTNTDIQADNAQLQDWMLRQLAYGGPFSVPHIAKDIVDYRSFRVFPESRGDRVGEVYHGRFGRQTWTNTNGVTIGAHPPLPYWYARPGQVRSQLVI